MQVEFKKAYQTMKWDELPVQWTDVEEQGLKEAAKKARLGVGFVVCKQGFKLDEIARMHISISGVVEPYGE